MSEREIYYAQPKKEKLALWLKIVTWIITIFVLLLVGAMRRPELRIPLPEGVSLAFLPLTHAILNTMVFVLLVSALVAVLKGKITLHKRLIFAAIGCSVVFLLGYVAYHFTTAEVLFGDVNKDGVIDSSEQAKVGAMRAIYLGILFTHIIAAAVSLPAILLTLTAALTNQFSKHRSMARWVFPVWLFVAVTGPICYFMLRPYYP